MLPRIRVVAVDLYKQPPGIQRARAVVELVPLSCWPYRRLLSTCVWISNWLLRCVEPADNECQVMKCLSVQKKSSQKWMFDYLKKQSFHTKPSGINRCTRFNSGRRDGNIVFLMAHLINLLNSSACGFLQHWDTKSSHACLFHEWLISDAA